jgi:NAD(P)-dependent dehydrogenase (short-subunit alcohol dehydrogenase family)
LAWRWRATPPPAAIVAGARSTDALGRLAAEAPGQVLAIRLDVTATGDAERAVDAAIARFGRIDVLFNNAGYGVVGALEETPEVELRAQMETNFFGAVAMTRAVLPVLRAQESGAIVNISSLSAYSASKFALEGLSEALAGEMAHFGVKVLIVEPGQLRTEFAGPAMRHMPQMDAYAPIVGGTREFASGMHRTQFGDPLKAARAIESALDAVVTPLRLQLGGDAVDSIRGHAEQMLAEIAAWEEVARSIAFDPQETQHLAA